MSSADLPSHDQILGIARRVIATLGDSVDPNSKGVRLHVDTNKFGKTTLRLGIRQAFLQEVLEDGRESGYWGSGYPVEAYQEIFKAVGLKTGIRLSPDSAVGYLYLEVPLRKPSDIEKLERAVGKAREYHITELADFRQSVADIFREYGISAAEVRQNTGAMPTVPTQSKKLDPMVEDSLYYIAKAQVSGKSVPPDAAPQVISRLVTSMKLTQDDLQAVSQLLEAVARGKHATKAGKGPRKPPGRDR